MLEEGGKERPGKEKERIALPFLVITTRGKKEEKKRNQEKEKEDWPLGA